MKFGSFAADTRVMSSGATNDSTFARATRSVLEHLSETSGLRTWALCRFELEGSYTLSVTDPRDEVHLHEVLPAPMSRSSDRWVSAPVLLPDGSLFGELVGFDPNERTSHVEQVVPTLQVYAMLLGSLAGTEMALAGEHRVQQIVNGPADPLTGLGTRQGWEQRVRYEEHFCREFGEQAWVMAIELTELKRYNELHGHSAGDEQLRTAGQAVRAVLDGRHYGARLTGDRFGVHLIGVDEQGVHQITRAIHSALSAAGAPVATGIGRRRPETGLGGALAAAEAQLDRDHHPDGSFDSVSAEAAVLVDALEMGAIRPYFQPIVNLHTGEVVAIEALARWQSSDGVREPDHFLPVLRQTGLLGALFDRMLDDGLATIAEYRHVAPQLQLAVNFQFDTRMESSLLDSIIDQLTKHGLQPSSLVLEFSERQSFDLPDHLRKEMEQVAALGVELVLDDFGTGFASLETLTSLPISGVKLNRKFTAQVVGGDRAGSVMRAMVAVAMKTGLSVVAEGIETELQREQLVGIGCTLGQGYLFALPQPADSLAAVLSAPLANLV